VSSSNRRVHREEREGNGGGVGSVPRGGKEMGERERAPGTAVDSAG
jgi:hypothetical protein